MTLIEVVLAVVILSAVVLALGGFSAQFSQANSQAHLVIVANEIAGRRIDAVRQSPTYAAIDTLETPASRGSDTVTSDFQVFTRTTHVFHDSTALTDYRRVTVTVKHNSWLRSGKSVVKSTAVAAF